MSNRTRHYTNAVNKIHHKEIEEQWPQTSIEKNAIEDFIHYTGEGFACVVVESKLSFREIEDESEQFSIAGDEAQLFDVDNVAIEDIIPSRDQTFIEIDDEDKNFGDPANIFEQRLEFFGTIVGKSMKLFFPTCEEKTKRAGKPIPAHLALHHF